MARASAAVRPDDEGDRPDDEAAASEGDGEVAELGAEEAAGDRPRKRPKPGRPAPPSGLEATPAMKELRHQEGQAVADFFRGFAQGQADVRIYVERRSPERHRNVKCNGVLGHYEGIVDDVEERVRRDHGGGSFLLILKERKKVGGGFRYVTSRAIEIPGDPDVSNLRDREDLAGATPVAAAGGTGDALAIKAFDVLERQTRAQSPQGDPAILEMLKQMRADMAAKDTLIQRLMMERSAPPPQDPVQSRLLDKMLDGDNARITALRTQHDSELRVIRDNARADEERLRARHDSDVAAIRASYEREIATMRASHERELASIKASHEFAQRSQTSSSDTMKEVTRGQISALERENTALRAEVVELRGTKNKSIVDMAKELKAVKEAIGDDDDKEESAGGTIAQITKIVGESKIGLAIAKKIAGGDDAPRQVPGVPYARDGRVYVIDQQGNEHPVQQRQQRRVGPATQRARPAVATGTAQPAPAATGAEGEQQQAPAPAPLPQIPAMELGLATSYLESAFRGGQAPEVVAQSASSQVPPAILNAIRELGVDEFLRRVAKLPNDSPLLQQKGLLWVRKVAAALIG